MKFPYALITLTVISFFARATKSKPVTPSEILSTGRLAYPKIKDLHKDSHKTTIWSAEHGWLSCPISFVTHVDAFLGIQWQGVNFGNIITCVFLSNKKMTFPIILGYNPLIYQLTEWIIERKWSKNLSGYV